MKYLKNLILGDFLNYQSLNEIKIDKIELHSYQILEIEPEKLLKIFNIISKNKKTISNGAHLLTIILSKTGERLRDLIVYNKKTDPILEEIISNSIYETVNHISNCERFKIKTDFKIDENKIIEKQDPYLVIEYIREIKKSRFPAAEPMLLKSPEVAINYCAKYIKEPWKELEKEIEKTNTKMLYFNYIYDVIFPYYKKQSKDKNIRSIIKQNYPLYEKKIMTGFYKKEIVLPVYTYATEIIGGRWLEFEKMVEDEIKSTGYFQEDARYDFFYYMLKIYPGRWKIAEPYLFNFTTSFFERTVLEIRNYENYINEKVITEYKEKIKTFEDLQKYKDEFNMWDKLLQGREIIFIFNPVYMLIKLRNLVNYHDKKIVKDLFKEYFPLNYKENIEGII